jgi:hypothetical protein
MRISESPDRMILSDVPGAMWLLGGVFVLSGSFLLSVPLWSADWRMFGLLARTAVLVIGAAHLAGGIVSVRQPAATRAVLDRTCATGVIEVRRLWRRAPHRTDFALADARSIEIVRSTDSEGDPMFQLRLWLSGSRMLWLQAQAVRGEARVREEAARVRRFLGIA